MQIAQDNMFASLNPFETLIELPKEKAVETTTIASTIFEDECQTLIEIVHGDIT